MARRLGLVSAQGKERLGLVLKASREARDWSMEALVDEIERVTGHKLGRSTISNLERGHNIPSWDTLALLEAAEYVVWPGTDELLTASDMFEIASERVDPKQDKGKLRVSSLTYSSRFSGIGGRVLATSLN